MSQSINERLAQIGYGTCSVQGCHRRRHRVGSLCLPHQQAYWLHGHELARPLLKTEIKSHLALVERTLKANSSHPAIQQTMQDIQDLLNRAVEAAAMIKTRPGPGQVAARVALELARLQDLGVTPFEILTITLAIQLRDSERAFRTTAVFFCAIARHLVVLRKHGDK